MTPLDVVCVGEALVDFLPTQAGRRVRDVETWVRCIGGSPANVAVGLSRLGARSAMVGVVGADEFGEFLAEGLAREGVDVGHLRRTDEGKTGLVFISLTEAGERSFAFHRTRAAELFLEERDVDPLLIARARAVHCGTNSLLWKKAQRAMLAVASAARQGGKIFCADPNLRLHAWPEPGELKELLEVLLPMCTVVKLAEDELEFVTGKRAVEPALLALRKAGVLLPVVTSGAEGASFLWAERVVRVPAPSARVVDTTGAGDGFVAALLFGLTRLFSGREELERAGVGELREIVTFACRVGARVVEKLGAVPGLPKLAEVESLLPGVLRDALGR